MPGDTDLPGHRSLCRPANIGSGILIPAFALSARIVGRVRLSRQYPGSSRSLPLSDIAGWIAPLATALAAVMTASNLGARVTGWGFVVFLVGSICWCIVALTTDQPNLLWANGFLTLVNGLGIWRWLGRQARYERGGRRASARSARTASSTLVPLGSLIGGTVSGPDGSPLGQITEIMMRCDDAAPAYLVVSVGGLGGVGESLHALDAAEFDLCADGIRSHVSATVLGARTPIAPDNWPAKA